MFSILRCICDSSICLSGIVMLLSMNVVMLKAPGQL